MEDLAAESALPCDRPRPAVPGRRADRVGFTVDAGTVAQLQRVARSAGATLFMALHTAVAVMLHDSGAGHDIAVGTVVAGRAGADLDRLVGFFVNTVVLRTDLSGRPSLRQVLAGVRDTALRAFEHQDVPFEVLVDALRPEPAPGRNPIFQVALLFEQEDGATLKLPGVRVEQLPQENDVAKWDLTLLARTTGEGTLSVELAYAVDLFDRTTAEAMGQRLENALLTLATDPEVPVNCGRSTRITGPKPADHTVRRYLSASPEIAPPEGW